MQLTTLPLGPLHTNCYLLLDDAARRALVIDPGFGPEPAIARLQGYTVEAVLLTHGHWDHIYGTQALKDATGAPVWISEIEQDWLTDPLLNRSGYRSDLLKAPCTGPAPDRLLHDGDTFTFAGQQFTALLVPGHTPGSLCFATDGLVIAGDTLFRGTIGRGDLPGGNTAQLIAAIREKLLPLPDETVVAPGHGRPTTIGREKEMNPCIGGRPPLLPLD